MRMATNSRTKTELMIPKRRQAKETRTESTQWLESKEAGEQKKVDVVYYLSRNGQLEHPHFIEVPLSFPEGLYLRDVLNRLNSLRGQGMANLYSWSVKRSYKNGFVWQDLSDNDFIYPSHGHEYVLKGSLLLETSLSFRSNETTSSDSSIVSKSSSETYSSSEGSNFPSAIRRRNHSWGTTTDDPNERNKIYKAKITQEFNSGASDVSTQTYDNIRLSQVGCEEIEEHEGSIEMRGQKISLSFSRCASELSEDFDQCVKVGGSADIRDQTIGNDRPSGRIKASSILMELISCVSRRINDNEFMGSKDKSGQ